MHKQSAASIDNPYTSLITLSFACSLQTRKTAIQKYMPKEDRLIIFSNEEVYKAIFALSTQKQLKKPPAGQVTKVTEDPEDKNKITIHLHNPQETFDKDITVDYTRDFLAAALMLFCRGLGIPLPKSARKSVMLRNDEAMLRVQI